MSSNNCLKEVHTKGYSKDIYPLEKSVEKVSEFVLKMGRILAIKKGRKVVQAKGRVKAKTYLWENIGHCSVNITLASLSMKL